MVVVRGGGSCPCICGGGALPRPNNREAALLLCVASLSFNVFFYPSGRKFSSRRFRADQTFHGVVHYFVRYLWVALAEYVVCNIFCCLGDLLVREHEYQGQRYVPGVLIVPLRRIEPHRKEYIAVAMVMSEYGTLHAAAIKSLGQGAARWQSQGLLNNLIFDSSG